MLATKHIPEEFDTKGKCTQKHLYSLCTPHVHTYIHIQVIIDLYQSHNYFTTVSMHTITHYT